MVDATSVKTNHGKKYLMCQPSKLFLSKMTVPQDTVESKILIYDIEQKIF